MFDLVIRGGQVYDGTGKDPIVADVGITNGMIVAVGPGLGNGRNEIDAAGKLVTPGFVDIHSHYDGQVTWSDRLEPSSLHGITTVVMGNCAIGFAPCKEEQRDLLIGVVSGVEDIPEAVMAEGLPWNWETFPEYLDALDKRRCDIDFATQVPHAAVRVYVMGKRGAERELATSTDLKAMTALVREGVEAGALGVSTSHTLAHRTLRGDLAPCETAAESELQALAEGLRQAGRGVYELIIDFNDVSEGRSTEFDMLKRIATRAGCPLTYTLVQTPYDVEAWRDLLAMTEAANREGLNIKGQVAARAVGMCFGLDLSFNPFSFHPTYRSLADLPFAQRVEQLRRAEIRQRILSEQPVDAPQALIELVSRYPKTFQLGKELDYEPPRSEILEVKAADLGVTVAELAYDLMLDNDGNSMLYLPITNFHDGTLSAALAMMKSDATIIALGDGGAHYGLICDAAYPTFALSHWVRDRKGERVSLPWMVEQLTRIPARALGLDDRGVIAPGFKADLNVIDFEQLKLLPPEVVRDLPGDGRRMMQRAEGYVATVVSGEVTYRHGQATGALPGRLVRGARQADAMAA